MHQMEGTPVNLLTKMHQAYPAHSPGTPRGTPYAAGAGAKCEPLLPLQGEEGRFQLQHYAGTVTYEVSCPPQ